MLGIRMANSLKGTRSGWSLRHDFCHVLSDDICQVNVYDNTQMYSW